MLSSITWKEGSKSGVRRDVSFIAFYAWLVRLECGVPCVETLEEKGSFAIASGF